LSEAIGRGETLVIWNASRYDNDVYYYYIYNYKNNDNNNYNNYNY